MNKIVREHYPVSKLPAELRVGLSAGMSVRVTIEEEATIPVSREDLLLSIETVQSKKYGTTLEEAVTRVRELRDEWD